MNSYTFFAKVYDIFMDDIPYSDWVDRICEYLEEAGYTACKALELGCGTGRFGSLMSTEGYEVTGIDLSKEMIKQAIKRGRHFRLNTSYQVMDMRKLTFKNEFPVVVSVCDSMNYLADTDELYDTLVGVREALSEGGIFIFDMKTEAFFKSLGEEIYSDEKDIGEYYWENYYDEETRNNDYYISFYIKKGRLYRKFVEEHTQHAFTPEEVRDVAKRAGLTIIEERNSEFEASADYSGERIYFIMKKEG